MANRDTRTIIHAVIGGNIRKLRIKEKCSQQKLADMIGMNRTYLSDIEMGKGNASVDILIKIADGFDIPITGLFEGLEDGSPSSLSDDLATHAVVNTD